MKAYGHKILCDVRVLHDDHVDQAIVSLLYKKVGVFVIDIDSLISVDFELEIGGEVPNFVASCVDELTGIIVDICRILDATLSGVKCCCHVGNELFSFVSMISYVDDASVRFLEKDGRNLP